MKKRHWVKWHWQDHDAEPGLRYCSIAANGLWIRMLGIMASSQPYGHLVQHNGKPIPDVKLHKAIPMQATLEEVAAALRELEEHGVFSRTPEGVIYCRRMVREDEKSRRMAALAQRSWQKRRQPKPPQAQGQGPRPERQSRRGDRLEDEMRRLSEGGGR